MEDLSSAYDNRGRVKDHPRWFEAWAEMSRTARSGARFDTLCYGDHPRQTLDLFQPEGAPEGSPILFLHGGYWQALSGESFSFIGKAFADLGHPCAIATYRLCPEVSVADIVADARAAALFLARKTGGGITVLGHSAGGHLAAMLIAEPDLPVTRAAGFSGLYQLRPLIETPVNTALGLDATSADTLSPAYRTPPLGRHFLALVGGLESDEYKRQNQLIVDAWRWRLHTQAEICADLHHFSILDGLVPGGGMARSISAWIGGGQAASDLT